MNNTARKEHDVKGNPPPAVVGKLQEVSLVMRRSLDDALAELRMAQQDRAFMATRCGMAVAPLRDRITATAVHHAEPGTHRDGPPPVPGL